MNLLKKSIKRKKKTLEEVMGRILAPTAGTGRRSKDILERVLVELGVPKERTALQGHCSSEQPLTCEHRSQPHRPLAVAAGAALTP